MKFSDLKGIFAQEQTDQGLRVIGLDANGRQIEALFRIGTEPQADWEAIHVRPL
jgi:hypothetical protein